MKIVGIKYRAVRKSVSLLLLLLFPFVMCAQIITTISGTVGGLVYDPNQMAFDIYGNLYIATFTGNTVVKMDTTGTVSVFAGTGTGGYSGDGSLATLAELHGCSAVTTDTFGNVYIADGGNNRIRKVNVSTGIITTIAGTGYGAPYSGGYSGDGGHADSAELFGPGGLCFDKYGNLYFDDAGNYRLRKIDTSGIITSVAGNGVAGSNGDGGLASLAECAPSQEVCIDSSGNIYFIDQENFTIRKVNTLGIISTIAGDSSGLWMYSGDGVPALGANIAPSSITFDKNGLLYISDNSNNRVRMIDADGIIHTVAGDGIEGSTGDGGPADSAEINSLCGIAFDNCDNLFIAQLNQPQIREVLFNPSCLPSSTAQVTVNQLHIYPNPTDNVLNIDGVSTGTGYAIINITGITEQSGTLKQGNNSLSLQSLSPGIYMLQLTDYTGQKTISKIIKQ